jgi:LmbE family N-acetylglucosaminyl deacetylase
MIIPKTDYSGQDVKKELIRVVSEFRPTLIAFTRHEDQHPDHCATSLFVQEALIELQEKIPELRPRLCTYLIHFNDYPIGEESGFGSRLYPPKVFPLPANIWTSFALTPQEAETKHKALLLYDSQMLVIGRFLLSFSRANELFILQGDPAEELKKERCCFP